MNEWQAVELVGFLTRSKAIWNNPALLNLVESAPSPTKAYAMVLQNSGSQRKAKAARWYACAVRDFGKDQLGGLVAVLRSPQGAEKLEELLTTTSLKTGQEKGEAMSKKKVGNVGELKEVVNPLLDFVEVKASQGIDEEAVVAEAKAQLAVQAEEEKKRQIRALAHNKALFTDEGMFGKLPVEQQRGLLVAIMDFLEGETQDHIKRSQQSSFSDGIDWDDSNVDIRLDHLVNAARHNVILPDWKERIAQVNGATEYYPGRYSQRVIGFERDRIQKAASQIDQLSGEIPEGLTGKGLEFAPSAVGSGRKVYLDGQFVISLSEARFGSNPTNGEVIAWLTVNQIDYCSIKGAQIMWEIEAWKKGDKEPRRVFEDHAYNSEGRLALSPPSVEADGTVVFEHLTDEGAKEKRIKL